MTLNRVRTGANLAMVVFISAIFILAILIGVGVGIGAYIWIAPFVLLLPCLYLLMRPDICLVFFSGLTLLVSGSLKYFLGLGQLQWALSVLGVALLGYSLVRTLFVEKHKRIPADKITQVMLLWWVGLIFSSMANGLPVLDWLVGLRVYLPVYGIFAYVAYGQPSEKLLKGLLLFMLIIASVQWIFCLYQVLRVVPMRIALHYPGSPWDSVVGSFGGEKFGGGESGSLGVFLSIVMVLAAALKKYGQIRNLPLLIVFLAGFSAMVLTESKVIAVMIPLGCFLVYRNYIFKKPAKFLLGVLALSGLMLLLLVAYYFMYWQTENNLGLVDALYARFAYSFDPHFQASTANLGRVGSLIFWWDKHAIVDNPLTFLFGHGLSSAISSSAVINEGIAVRQYGIMLDVTGVSKLLWESGIIGFFVFLLIFVFGFIHAQRLKNIMALPEWHRAAMGGVEAAMVIMPLAIFYEVTVVGSLPMQFMAMYMLGYVVYWWRVTEGASHV